MKKSKISIVYHSTVFETHEGYFLKKHWATYLIDFSKIYDLNVICFTSKTREFFHDFFIEKNKINFCLSDEKNFITKFISRIKIFKSLLPYSELTLILMPSKTSILAGIYSILISKKYALYFGLEPFNDRYNFMIKTLIRLILRKSSFSIGTGPQVVSELKKFSSDVYSTKPNILYSLNDIKTDKKFNSTVKLLFVGSLEKRKGLEFLIKALSNPEIKNNIDKLTIVGGGVLFSQLKNLSKELDLEKTIEFTGYVSNKSDLQKFYVESDIFVLPSFEEGFPRVLYESMINGLAILTTPVNSIPDILEDEKTAIFFKPGSSKEIENALLRVITNKDLIEKISKNSQKIIYNIIDQSASKQHSILINQFIS